MPYQFDFDQKNRILGVRYQGPINDESIKACYKATPRVVNRADPRALIIDLSGVTTFDVSPQTIRELAEYKPTVQDPAIPRVIIAPTAYLFGMSRMFQIWGGATRPMLQVVKTADEAYTELGVVNPQFEPLPQD